MDNRMVSNAAASVRWVNERERKTTYEGNHCTGGFAVPSSTRGSSVTGLVSALDLLLFLRVRRPKLQRCFFFTSPGGTGGLEATARNLGCVGE